MTLAAIFDHDGVLVDSLSLHQDAWLELGGRTGLPFTPEFIRDTFGMTNFSIMERVLGADYTREAAQHYGDLKEECYRAVAADRVALMDGVRELLDDLTARGVLLAIGSSAPRANLLLTVERCGLAGRFASIAALEDIARGKPDPEVFLRAAAGCQADPARCAVFEDAGVGIEAAKAAGMHAVGVTTTNPADILRERGADLVVDSLAKFDADALIRTLKSR